MKIEGVIVQDDRLVGYVMRGDEGQAVTLEPDAPRAMIRAKVVKPKLVTPGGSNWIAHEHVDKGDWLWDGTLLIGRAIEDCAFGAHIKEPVEKP